MAVNGTALKGTAVKETAGATDRAASAAADAGEGPTVPAIQLWERPGLRRRLVAFARRFVGDGALAEDVVQETLWRAVAGCADLREPEKAEAWVFRICRHAAIDRVRTLRVRQGVWGTMPEGVDDWAPRDATGDVEREDAGEFEPADLRRLPAHHRLLMALHYEKGLSQATICRMTGLSPSALRVRLFRARGALAATGRRRVGATDDRRAASVRV